MTEVAECEPTRAPAKVPPSAASSGDEPERPSPTAWPPRSPQQVAAKELLRRGGIERLWIFGAMPSGPRIGVVGARKATSAQLAATRDVVDGLVLAGAVVVSGGARGVDAAAHRQAIARRGKTVIALPSGLLGADARQRTLGREVIAANGAVMSCEALATGHLPGCYRRRNRVVCGLIDALIVVCAARDSGTTMTSNMARKQGIPVRVVPWNPGTSHAEGSNRLLVAGCRAVCGVEGAREVVSELTAEGPIDGAVDGWQRYAPPEPPRRLPLAVASGGDPRLIAAIDCALTDASDQALSLEELVELTGAPRGELAAALLHLCISGQVQRASFGRYQVR